jgi:hypothetical protein
MTVKEYKKEIIDGEEVMTLVREYEVPDELPEDAQGTGA